MAFGIVGLINLKASDLFQRNIWIAGFVSVVMVLIFHKGYSYYAAAAAWSVAEALLFVLCLWSLRVVKRKSESV